MLRCIHRHLPHEHPNCFKENNFKKSPKILLMDIETAPLEVYVWDLDQKFISTDSIINDWFVLSWSAKWLFNSKILSDVLTPKEALEKNDKRLVGNIRQLLDEADIIIAHNGKSFDVPKLYTRFIKNGFLPPSPFKIIDTLTQARKIFKFTSNKLDYITKFLGLPQKGHPGFGVWKGCLKGNKDSLKELKEYNANDVDILEEVYVKLRPWMVGHPNLSVYTELEKPVCPTCLSHELSWEDEYVTSTGVYRKFVCKSCGAFGRGNKNILTKEQKEVITKC